MKGHTKRHIDMKGVYTRKDIWIEEIYTWRGYIYKKTFTKRRHSYRLDIYTEKIYIGKKHIYKKDKRYTLIILG